jgi:GNAT superfamily N-acetyltransferase
MPAAKRSRVKGSTTVTPGLTLRDLEPSDWPAIEKLFGRNGACGGCWCMTWRIRGGKAWKANKGEPNRRSFRSLIEGGRVFGVLAFDGTEPVGWCNVGPRNDYERLLRSRVLASPAPADWAVTCFYIPAARRGRGIASALLERAVDLARRSGAQALEGYPVEPSRRSRSSAERARIPAAFAWTGVRALFERAGFTDVTPRGATRPIYRIGFARAKAPRRSS